MSSKTKNLSKSERRRSQSVPRCYKYNHNWETQLWAKGNYIVYLIYRIDLSTI